MPALADEEVCLGSSVFVIVDVVSLWHVAAAELQIDYCFESPTEVFAGKGVRSPIQERHIHRIYLCVYKTLR